MNPIYLDIHIHTSENPNNLNEDYDVDRLIEKIKEISGDSNFLISLTDHNTINKSAYLKLIANHDKVLLGTELHIEYSKERKPYHCHIFFNVTVIDEESIDKINAVLDRLYPDKEISVETENIPHIEDIIREFDDYDFILMPHGGQSHSTFDKSIPHGAKFDTTIERSIYYNQFDGFTARSDDGLDRTAEYFKKLGIYDFVNLVTCTDNYQPHKYPDAKAADAKPFIPTWMLSQPTFSGLRLALSESSRLFRKDKPIKWSEYIGKVNLNNELIEINVELTPGLNVVIGSSSSGKTLFVDSIYNKIKGNFGGTKYAEFNVENINVDNPSGVIPHYINQNYIIELISEKSEGGIEDIPIIKRVFPEDDQITQIVRHGLAGFKKDLEALIDAVKDIEKISDELKHIPFLSRLIVTEKIRDNIVVGLEPSDRIIEKFGYNEVKYEKHTETLDEIKNFLEKNPFVDNESDSIERIKERLFKAYRIAKFEESVRSVLNSNSKKVDLELSTENHELQTKKTNFRTLIEKVSQYIAALIKFEKALESISKYSIECKTQEKKSMGHKLFIENNFKLSKEKFVEVLNKFRTADNAIKDYNDIKPKLLFIDRFSQRPKVRDYDDIVSKIYSVFEKLNRRTYRIISADGRSFDNLSAGWKTSVLIDLILGYLDDTAPLIIDQPEDNLATDYINTGLISAIKSVKSKKQIILVSHNATIPMLGDAQNIILCQNNGSINIRSNQLEGFIDEKSVVDYIAEITDGGKPSIKKRVKKYNLKNYRE